MKRAAVALLAGMSLVSGAVFGSDDVPPTSLQLKTRYVRPKPEFTPVQEGVFRKAVVLKIAQPSRVRLRAGRLESLDRQHDVTLVNELIQEFAGIKLERLFSRAEQQLENEKALGEQAIGKELGDLNLYYLVDLREIPGVDPEGFVDALNALGLVELAYQMPRAEPSGVITDEGGIHTLQVAPLGGLGDYEPMQTYLDPAPTGIDAEWAWSLTGGRGANVRFIDIEWDWNFNHIDLPAPFIKIPSTEPIAAPVCDTTAPPPINVCSYESNHGTAVVGEVVSINNGWGTTGIASDAQWGVSDASNGGSWPTNVANAINLAAAALSAGDILLYEMHGPGPVSGLTCPCNCTQFEYVAMEYWQANFDATQAAVALGIHVVEAAGNGAMNLDSGIYGGLFNRSVRDSGAIVVGAGNSWDRAPACFTNRGSRVDMQGYGDSVVTTGYGRQYSVFPNSCPPVSNCNTNHDSMFDNAFAGTSSASPIIVGAAAIVEGVSETKYGRTISPAQMRDILVINATPQGSPASGNIGPLPDLKQVIRADLTPNDPAGWPDSIVATASTTCTSSSCAPGATLPGNSTATYFNYSGRNDGVYESVGSEARIYLDDNWEWVQGWGVFLPGAWGAGTNIGPTYVRGGRHTVRVDWDATDSVPEWNDLNNSDYAQFVWSPRVLTANTPLIRAAPPDRDTAGYFWYNCDGLEVTGLGGSNSWWAGTAVLPLNATDDYDVRLHTETPTSTTGFGANVANSSWGAGMSDFVLQNGNHVGSTETQWVGLLQGSGVPATGSAVVEFSVGTLHSPPQGSHGPYALGSGSVLHVHELDFAAADAGASFDVKLTNLGSADLGISMYDASLSHASKSDYMTGAYADSNGPGGDEVFSVTIPADDYYGLVVWKAGSSDRLLASDYTLEITLTLPDLEPHRPAGWSSPVVLRDTTGCTTSTCADTPTLLGNSNLSYFNHTAVNAGPNPSSGTHRTQYYVDDSPWGWYQSTSSVPAGGTFSHINYQSLYPITGGRHTVGVDVDVLDGVAESNESDNTHYKQYVLSPYALTQDLPVTRGAPPDRDSTGYSWYNCDGLSYVTGWWGATAIMPANGGNNYDLRLHDDYAGSTTGFGTHYAWSNEGAGLSDFVLVNGNNVGSGTTWYPGVIQGTDTPTTGSVAVHHVNQGATVTPPGTFGPYGIPSNGVLFILELEMNALAGRTFVFDLLNDTGGADLGFGLFDTGGSHFRKADAFASANNQGAGSGELFIASIPTNGYYGLAVWKSGSADLALASDFRVRLTEVLPTATPDGSGGSEPLRLAKPTLSSLTVTWGDECNSQVSGGDETLYIGDLDQLRSAATWDYSGHLPICTTGSDRTETITTPPGNVFFLVVPHNGNVEGSYGYDSALGERPTASGAACHSQELSGSCL